MDSWNRLIGRSGHRVIEGNIYVAGSCPRLVEMTKTFTATMAKHRKETNAWLFLRSLRPLRLLHWGSSIQKQDEKAPVRVIAPTAGVLRVLHGIRRQIVSYALGLT